MGDRFVPLSVPNLKGNELNYITKAVETEWVSTGGPYVDEFEKMVAGYVHSAGAVSCQNGTSGLHTSLMLLGVTPEDIVLVPTLTFIAAVNPVRYIGAEPVFMDCDDSLCMDPEKLRSYCEEECELVDDKLIDKQSGKQVKAVVVVHVFGNMADMEAIMDIADKYNLKVLEDATEAIGTYYTEGRYEGRYAGTIGHMGVYSFNGNKIITTGGGGMIVSMDESLLKRAKHLTTQAKSDEVFYTHDEIGYNYRMTNLQAAMGIAQMEQLEGFIETKTDNYNRYVDKLRDVAGVSLYKVRQGIRSNYWFYGLDVEKVCMNLREMITYLHSQGVQSRPIWGLIHQQKPYEGSRAYKIVKAVEYQSKTINIPCSTKLTYEDIDYVIEAIKRYIDEHR
ncbi:MAG: LegC family aminotransferase [Lachnospiraceae bacterium]|nr:LegC family aminotransferase [Lachnospiraceae bacterium]